MSPTRLRVRITRALTRTSLDAASRLVSPIDRRIRRDLGEHGLLQFPPVLIVGPPRSGSTLLYKALTDRFRFIFFNNLSSFLWRTPGVGAWLTRATGLKPQRGDYDIRDGKLRGWGEPHECGVFWYQWFSRDNVFVGPGETSSATLTEIRASVGAMAALAKAPPLFKNLSNSMRVAALVEAMPEVSFLVCRRNALENALSLLDGRERNLGSKEAWWSLKPKETDHLKRLTYPEQVAGQVLYTLRQLQADAERFGSERFLTIDYESLCENAPETLKKIERFLRSRNVPLEVHGEVPPSFQVRKAYSVSGDDRERVRRAIERLEAELRTHV